MPKDFKKMQTQIESLQRQINNMQNDNLMTPSFIRSIQRVASPSLSSLADVLLTSPSNGQVLKYNGTKWINDTDLTA